ncbi:MAG: HD domain-containing protein [Candidatus Magasanikbacteria bacterium]|jgi:poly(A) polymerase|nr:HD domain-containing protein [Candidatus Magasanikbacteria bacterium]MBT4314997.1 HD domain-containing protein [Candidatus Magasanikbacteria bacterium]MBT4546953.1 HD domain-containing protein [Candidatus Magasanikbacteria bacterium]MBT6819575.1 HD domain-containing protein [Candidatus Magasanikbacteria bacterium]
MNVSKILKAIYKVAKKEKVEVYAVGGFVRDRLLGIKKKEADIDFVVLGSGLEFAKKLDKTLKEEGSLVEFPDFDTARYVFTKELKDGTKKKLLEIEFAGARSEAYDKKSRKPKVESTSLEEDLKRRDFTVNAMAQQVIASGLSKKIIDIFGGQVDLENKILKTPLDPDETFSEDPLRMLRAARFVAQLDFGIDKSALGAIAKNKKRLKIISAERVQEELFKLLKTSNPSIGFQILYTTGLLDEFLPEISALQGVEEIYGQHHKNNFEHTLKVVDNIAERTDSTVLRFAALLHDIGKPGTKSFLKGRGWAFDMHEHLGLKMVRTIGKRLRMSKDDTEYIGKLVRWHQQPIQLMDEGVTDSAVRRLIVNLGDDLDDLLKLCRSDITTGNPKKLKKRLKNYDYLEKRIEEVMETDKLRDFQSPVRGEEIMKECGLKPGPTVGKIKTAIEEAILDGKIKNEYKPAKKYFEEIKDEYLKKVNKWERV